MRIRRFIDTFDDIDYTQDQLLNNQNVKGVILDRKNDFIISSSRSLVGSGIRQGFYLIDDFRDIVLRPSLSPREILMISLNLLCDRCGADLSMESKSSKFSCLCEKCRKEIFPDSDFVTVHHFLNGERIGDSDGDRLSFDHKLKRNIDL